MKQIEEMATSEAYRDCEIRIMPDCHAGKGCTVGTVIQTAGKVVPNTIGVDIGCGMLVVNLGKKDINLSLLDRLIREYGENRSIGNVRQQLTARLKIATERKQADDRQILDRIMRSETGEQFQKAIEETKGGKV